MPSSASDFQPDASPVQFHLLGGVEACVHVEPINLGAPKSRLTLAALLAAEGRLVTADGLIDQIWDDAPPDTARELLYSYISVLRASLDPGQQAAGAPLPH